MTTANFELDRLVRKAPKAKKRDRNSRLDRFWDSLAPNSVAILVSNPERTRSRDTEYPYRQSSDILYLNGFPEPQSVLVVCKLSGRNKKRRIMFVQPKDRAKEIWTGVRVGVEGAKADYLVHEAFNIDQLEPELKKLVAQATNIYYRFGINMDFDEKFAPLWHGQQKTLLNYEEILHEMRLFKSADELAIMRHAAAISVEAHKAAMLATYPGVNENQVQAKLEWVFRHTGATFEAYGSIVASGNNAVILHYTSNDDTVKAGDLLLVDAACEFGGVAGGYASDITRCWPATGKFTPAQREIYQLVLDSQMAALRCIKPGVPLSKVHETASNVLRRGLFKLGILPSKFAPKKVKSPKKGKAAATPLALSDFYMHGTSHWMGLDVHDVGKYYTADGTRTDKGRGKRRMLEPGMVFTVEPGLYFDKDDKRVPAKYRGIGIRIEDDVVVTADGCENLTDAVPKTIDDIEALMAQRE